MSIIWKKSLPIGDVQTILLPQGADILCAREQHNGVSIWFECNPDGEPEARHIRMIPTGQEFDGDDCAYIGSCLFLNDDFVIHVYEVLE